MGNMSGFHLLQNAATITQDQYQLSATLGHDQMAKKLHQGLFSWGVLYTERSNRIPLDFTLSTTMLGQLLLSLQYTSIVSITTLPSHVPLGLIFLSQIIESFNPNFRGVWSSKSTTDRQCKIVKHQPYTDIERVNSNNPTYQVIGDMTFDIQFK